MKPQKFFDNVPPETWPDGSVVLDPVTQEPPKDRTLAIAIREGNHYITKMHPVRTVVQWHKFMKSRRHYAEIPAYFGLTEEEAQTWMKVCKEEWVNVSVVGKVLGHRERIKTIKFLRAKHVPVFKNPSESGGFYVFTGDLTRAIHSCMIDLNADGGAWAKYLMVSARAQKIAKERDAARREELRSNNVADKTAARA